MGLLHQKSPKCTIGELDLFSAPMTQLSIEIKFYTEILPLSAIRDACPIKYFILGHGEKYIDLNNTLLHRRIKVTHTEGSDLLNGVPVGLINYPLNTIFNQCDMVLGDRLISQSSDKHPCRAIIEILLNFQKMDFFTKIVGRYGLHHDQQRS